MGVAQKWLIFCNFWVLKKLEDNYVIQKTLYFSLPDVHSEEEISKKSKLNKLVKWNKSISQFSIFLEGKLWYLCIQNHISEIDLFVVITIFLPRLIKIFWPAVKYVRNQFIIPSPWCCNQIQGHFFKNFFFALYWIVCVYLSTFFGVNSG